MQSGDTTVIYFVTFKICYVKIKEIKLKNINILVLVVLIYSGIYCDMVPNIFLNESLENYNCPKKCSFPAENCLC